MSNVGGRPRAFDEDQLELDAEQRFQLFRAGLDAGHSAARMGRLLEWLDGARTSRTTEGVYRRILAELVDDDGNPVSPSSRSGRRRRSGRGGAHLHLLPGGASTVVLAAIAAHVPSVPAGAALLLAAPIIHEPAASPVAALTAHETGFQGGPLQAQPHWSVCTGRASVRPCYARSVHTDVEAA